MSEKTNIASKAARLTWERTKTAKKRLKDMYGEDYEVYHSGWPDLIAFNRKTGTFYFVECKRENEIKPDVSEMLRGDQDKLRKILERVGKKKSRYEIWFFENKKGSTKIVKRGFCDGNKLHFY